MNIEASERVAPAEGTALPLARPFGETSTITMAQGRRTGDRRAMVSPAPAALAAAEAGRVHLAVVPADPIPLTLTV